LVLAVLGQDLLADGFRLIMSHIDAPHLDVKVNPLYEDAQLAFLKTHYYGGIKKYHWPTIPLALHGLVVLTNGKKVEIDIGDQPDDPIFMITDLLPHLAKKTQMQKVLSEAITGEELNVLVGSLPVKAEKVKGKIRLAILEYLHKTYGLTAEDFFSAELQVTPAGQARDLGFDRSMIAAFGQDDRVCSYACLQAFLVSQPNRQTQICLWIDREEIGSEGATGAQSMFIENFIAELLEKSGCISSFKHVSQVLSLSQALSGDVTAALDPDYKDVHDQMNVAKLGSGTALEKYTGHGGKYGTSDASAEFVQKLRTIFNQRKVMWQTAGLGKIDEGGGGTIAMFLAKRNLEVIDIGVPILNMHAPMEISSKADVYSTYQAYLAFYQYVD